MKNNFANIRIGLIVFISVSAFFCVIAQTSETRVTLSSSVASEQVPLNRTVEWTVRIEWQDALSLIEIDNFEEPVLTNFDIVGSSASNTRLADESGQISIREISYTLIPKTLGMGYIESAAISYKDKATGESHHLMTQRIGVEVVDPVPEPGEVRTPWFLLIVGLVVACAIAIVLILRKRAQAKKEIECSEDQVPLEEKLLAELKSDVDLSSSNRNESLSIIVKVFRKFISEKYKIRALEATTSDLIGKLKESGLESRLVEKCEAMLSKADAIRFSGNEATPAELNEAYGTVESVLESHLKFQQENKE